MDKNIQDMLSGVLGSLPADAKEKALSCKSKDDFMGLIGSAKGLDLGGILGGLTGGGSADSNPLGGLLQGLGASAQGGGLLSQAGDLLKGVDWSEIQKFITDFFNKKT